MLSYSYPFEDQCFPFSSLKWVNNWCCYETIRKQYYAMQIICLSSFLKQTTYETISEGIKFLLNLTFYNRCLCRKLLLSHLYLPFNFKKLSPYEWKACCWCCLGKNTRINNLKFFCNLIILPELLLFAYMQLPFGSKVKWKFVGIWFGIKKKLAFLFRYLASVVCIAHIIVSLVTIKFGSDSTTGTDSKKHIGPVNKHFFTCVLQETVLKNFENFTENFCDGV